MNSRRPMADSVAKRSAKGGLDESPAVPNGSGYGFATLGDRGAPPNSLPPMGPSAGSVLDA